MVYYSLCEITAEKYEARQQVVIYSSNLCCLGENPCTNQDFSNSYFLKKFRGGHVICHVILVHHGNNHVALVCHLQAQVKNWHVVTTLSQHGPNNRSKLSEYGLQLAEKQKLRFSYGLGEKQFRNLFVQATKIKEGTLGFNFMVLLERRLDNVVYRLGLATTRRQARQFVNHGHILVDGKRVDIPSYRVEAGQVISVREKSMKVPAILEAVEATLGRPAFVSFDAEKLEGSLTRLPERDEINPEINEALVVEFYNKML